MPVFVEAARVRASEGEIVAALQAVYGTYTEHPPVLSGFVALRRR